MFTKVTNLVTSTRKTNTLKNSSRLVKCQAQILNLSTKSKDCILYRTNPDIICRAMSDFWEEGISENVCRLRFDHYEKRRRVKMQQVQEFMTAMRNSHNRKNMAFATSLSKESRLELKKCQSNIRIHSPQRQPDSLHKSYVFGGHQEELGERKRAVTNRNSMRPGRELINRSPQQYQT